MKRKFLSMVFKTNEGLVVPELSQPKTSPETVMAALHFLDSGYTLELKIIEVESDKG